MVNNEPLDSSTARLTGACEKLHKTCESFHKTITIFYVELAAFVLVGTFSLGVEFGKKLCN